MLFYSFGKTTEHDGAEDIFGSSEYHHMSFQRQLRNLVAHLIICKNQASETTKAEKGRVGAVVHHQELKVSSFISLFFTCSDCLSLIWPPLFFLHPVFSALHPSILSSPHLLSSPCFDSDVLGTYASPCNRTMKPLSFLPSPSLFFSPHLIHHLLIHRLSACLLACQFLCSSYFCVTAWCLEQKRQESLK